MQQFADSLNRPPPSLLCRQLLVGFVKRLGLSLGGQFGLWLPGRLSADNFDRPAPRHPATEGWGMKDEIPPSSFRLHPFLAGSGAVFNLGYLFYLLSLTFAQMITHLYLIPSCIESH